MKFPITYYPIQFYLIVMMASFVLVPIAMYFSYRGQMEKIIPFLLINLLAPCITAIAMIYFSRNKEMIQDFWSRLILFKIQPSFLAVILLLMPSTIFPATIISLAFGYSLDQFSLAKEFSVMKGWSLLGICIPVVLAPFIEELGWRGYGVDSLRTHSNLFITSVLFGGLWALWHLPLFFVKGYYQNQLWDLGLIHVVNFFMSVFVVASLMNWIYYHTDCSIPAIVLFHSILNLSSILLNTEPVTKCIATVLLCAVLFLVLLQDKDFFCDESIQPVARMVGVSGVHYQKGRQLDRNVNKADTIKELNRSLQYGLSQLRNQYDFPRETVSYVLSDGSKGSIAVGLADIERAIHDNQFSHASS